MLNSDLVQTFINSATGFCGEPDPLRKTREIEDPEIRLHYLTLAAVTGNFNNPAKLDILLDDSNLWLLRSEEVAYEKFPQVSRAFTQLRIGGAKQDARVWWQVCRGFQGRFKGSIAALLDANSWNTREAGAYLQESKTTFPVLSGPVISVRWLDLVSRHGGKPLTGWDNLIIPTAPGLANIAHIFTNTPEKLHPASIAAVEHWNAVCKGITGSGCAWLNCPNKEDTP